MKALSIWQPWASLIIGGAKPWEWRRWPAPSWAVGQRIVIHAAARPVRPDDIEVVRDSLAWGDGSLLPEKAQAVLDGSPELWMWPRGCGLGTGLLGAPIPVLEWCAAHAPELIVEGCVDYGRWAWPIGELQPFANPAPCRGAQRFWNWPEILE